MSSSSSCAKPEFKNGSIINGYKIIKKLGSGGFGAVYHVRKGDLDAALKTEFNSKESNQTLKNEVHILKLMQWSKSFCRLYDARRYIADGLRLNIMVMSLCGRPLSSLRRMMPDRHFSKSCAIRLSYQILEAIQDIHQTGILHRDIKASNCGWHENSRRVFLFDLGFCRKYLEKDPNTGKLRHRKPRKEAGFLGTSKYCSLNVHDELDQGRRDDLWSWLYTVSEFLLGNLPWSSEENTHLVYRRKRSIGGKLFLKCPREMISIYEHINSLEFESAPNYKLIFNQLNQMIVRYEIEWTDPMDFEQGSQYFEEFFFGKQTDTEKELESSTDGVDTKASRVVDLDEAQELTEHEEVTSKTNSRTSKKKFGDRLTAGLNKVFGKMKTFRKKEQLEN